MAINYTPQKGITNTYKTPEIENRVDAFVAQNDEYVRQLKERQQIHKMQDAYYYRMMQMQQEYNAAQNKRDDDLRLGAARQKSEIEMRRLDHEARAARHKAEMLAAKPSNFEKISKFVLDVAPKVAGMIETGERIYREEQEALAQLDYAHDPTRTPGPGSAVQSEASLNIAAEYDKVAGVNDISGGDPSNSHQFKVNANTIRGRHYLRLQAQNAGASMGMKFWSAVNDRSTPSQIKVSHQGQLYPINQLPDQKPETLDSAFTQYMIQHAKTAGYVDALGPGVIKFYEGAKAGWKPILANVYKQQYKSAVDNDLNQTEQHFQLAIKVPGREAEAGVDLFQGYLRTSNYNFKVANEKLITALSNPNIVSDAAFRELEDNLQLPGRPKPFAQDRPADWQQIQNNRQQANSRLYQQNMTIRRQGAQQRAEKLSAQFAADFAQDGDVDISEEQLNQLTAQIIAEGIPNDPSLAVINSFSKFTATEVQRADQMEQFSQAALNGSLTVGMVTRSSLSPQQKLSWIKRVQAGSVVSITPSVKQEGKNYIYSVLRGLGPEEQKYAPIEQARGPLQRATTFALNQWTQDYIAAAKDPKTASNPVAAANAAFESRVQQENGPYAVYSREEFIKASEEGNYDIKVGEFKNDFRVDPATVAPEDPRETVSRLYEKGGSNFITAPQPELVPSLQKIAKDINLGNPRMDIPPVYVEIAERYNTDPMTVIEQQFKANGIEYDENFFTPAKEAVQSVNPVYNSLLNFKPQTETTDVALIGSGQTPVYQEMPAIGAQTVDIIMSRESPLQGYEAMNNGNGGDSPGGAISHLGKRFSDMTLSEVLHHQNVTKKLWAAGAFQFVPNTLPEAMELAGVTPDMKFTPEVQRAMFWALFDRYGPSKWNPYWSNKATAQELDIMYRFQREYDYTKPTWMQSQNLNPQLATRLAE